MTYLTKESDNITLHYFNPAWAKPTECIQTASKVDKLQLNQENTKDYAKHTSNRKLPNSKLVQHLTKPTTASTLHSMNGAWVPTAEQLGVNSDIYRRRKIVIDDAANYKKPKFKKLRNEKDHEEIVQRLCRPTFSSSMHQTEKHEKFNMNSVIEAIKDINVKRQQKITIVNVGFPPVKQTESQIMKSFNFWIDENPLESMKIPVQSDSNNQGVNKSIKKCDQINNTKVEKPSKEINRKDKLSVNKIQESKKNKRKNISTRQLKPELKEKISCVTKDSLADSKLLNKPLNINLDKDSLTDSKLLSKPLNINLDITEQVSKKVIAPIKVRLINMDKNMRSKFQGKISKYEKILNSMLAESLEKFEFSFEKKQKI